MGQEKSYDSLPNFTAVDCLRWAGAVIEHVNNLQPTTAHPNTQVSIIWAFFPLSSLPGSCLKVLQKFDVFEMLWFEFRSRFCYESGFHQIFQNGSESMRNRIRNTDPTGSTEFNRHFLLLCTDCWALGGTSTSTWWTRPGPRPSLADFPPRCSARATGTSCPSVRSAIWSSCHGGPSR